MHTVNPLYECTGTTLISGNNTEVTNGGVTFTEKSHSREMYRAFGLNTETLWRLWGCGLAGGRGDEEIRRKGV